MKQLFISLIVSLLFTSSIAAQSIANYGFSTSTAAVLENMSTGTTQLIGPSAQDVASAVTNIGFSFGFMGNTFTQFSVNSNGQMRLGSTVISGAGITNVALNTPLFVPISDGNAILSTGKVHYKVKGTTPDRILIIEWKDLNVPYPIVDNYPPIVEYNPTQLQVYLYETTGIIKFKYGTVNNNSVPTVTRATFISSSNTANTVKYIAPNLISAVNGSSAGTYPLTLTNTDLLTLRQYVFTPTIPDAPTVTVVNNCDGTSTLTASNYTGTLLWSTMQTTPTITVSAAGVYTVTQTVGGFTSDPGSGTAAPKTAPSAPTVTVVNNCDGTSTLTASQFTGSLMWNTQQTSTSITVTTAGTYTVTQTVNGCTSLPGSGIADPKTPIQASVSIGVDNNPVCSGTSVTFTATPVNGGSTPTYQWYKGAAPVGTNSATYSYVPANGDVIKVVMTSNASPCLTGSPATSNTVTMVVNPTLTASVSIAVDNNPVCSGTSVTFTATPVNGGSTPSYQWYKGSTPVGTNSATYTYTPANGDMIKVVMTSNAGSCVTGSPATSNIVTMVVNQALTASVSISVDNNPVCSGTSVTFTATPVNGGSTPLYQWYKGATPVGTNSATYSYVPSNGDMIKVVMTSNAGSCVTGSPATSNTVTMVVNPTLTASVGISVDNNPVCSGTSVTFTATPVNGGSTPTYQWYKGAAPVGTNSATYSYVPANGDVIKVVMTSNASPCLTGSPATSNTVTMVVNQALTASVSIAVDNNPVCSGTSVTFTATPVNGGTAPSYQWYRCSIPVGTNSPVFTYAPEDADVIKVVMTSNDSPCLTGSPATSNAIAMKVFPTIVASVALEVNYNPVTLGRTVTFTAIPQGGGTSPVFRWFRNNLLIPNTGLEYTYTPLDKDEVYVEMTSNASPCLTGSPVNSNTIKMSVSMGTSLDQNGTDKINIYSIDNTILVNCREEVKQILLYNSLGTLIGSDQHVNGIKKFDMGSGVSQYYFVKIITQNTVYTQRVLLK